MSLSIEDVIKATIWFFIGAFMEVAIFYIKFENDYMRRELILIMQNGYNYFELFLYMNFLIIVFFVGVFIFIRNFWRFKKKKLKEKGNDVY